MSPRTQQVIGWSGLISLIVSLATIGMGFVKLGRRDAKIDEIDKQKVDQVVYQQDQTRLARELESMHGDIRVIRAAVCTRAPGACR